MKKTLSRLLAIAMTASLVLSGCGGTGGSTSTEEGTSTEGNTTSTEGEATAEAGSENEIKDLVLGILSSRELETFNILQSQRAEDFENLTQLVDGLLEADPDGKLVPAIADEWGTEDGGLTWKFHIRDGVKWVDVNGNEKGDCDSYDFASGLEWVLNFYKNDSANTSMPLEMIEGAEEYYEYTKTLTEEEAFALTAGEGSKFLEMVGVETPDANTIIYKCVAPKPYFDSLGAYNCLYPVDQAMIDELGGPAGYKSVNNENMWYNGCYTMTSYIQGNEKIFTKNPLYWDTECTRFDTVTYRMIESTDVGYQLYETGEIDAIGLSESQLSTITSDPNHKFYNYLVPATPSKYSYQFHFNFNKKNEDGTPDTNWNTAIANEAFRKAMYYGLDLTNYWKRTNVVDPMACENNFYTMKGLCYTSDGTDYVELVRKEMGLPEENGETPVRLDAAKAEEYKKQAMEELTALGVTFPVEIDYYIQGSNQNMLDSANVLKQTFSDCLGDDFVKLNILTYVQSSTQEVYNAKKHSMVVNGWGADYGDPQNYMSQEVMGNDNAFYSRQYSYIDDVVETEATKNLLDTYKEFTRLVDEASAINDDLDARYKAFAKAEAYMIQHALCFPHYYDVGWCLTKVNPYSKINAMYGCVNGKMKNWETNSEGYTTEEMEAIAEAYHAA